MTNLDYAFQEVLIREKMIAKITNQVKMEHETQLRSLNNRQFILAKEAAANIINYLNEIDVIQAEINLLERIGEKQNEENFNSFVCL